jgi:hypothetical protein
VKKNLYPKDGSRIFPRNIRSTFQKYAVSYFRRKPPEKSIGNGAIIWHLTNWLKEINKQQ